MPGRPGRREGLGFGWSWGRGLDAGGRSQEGPSGRPRGLLQSGPSLGVQDSVQVLPDKEGGSPLSPDPSPKLMPTTVS